MTNLFCFLNILLIIIHEFIQYGQTQIIKDDLSDRLNLDQAYLTISNRNYTDPIIFMYNLVVCENCDFETLNGSIVQNSNQTIIINTKYAYDFQVFSEHKNNTLVCRIKSHRFSEHGSYLLEIINTAPTQDSCLINQTTGSSYYWTPLIVGMVVTFLFIVLIQLWHHISNGQRFVRFLPHGIRQGLINDTIVIPLPSNVPTIAKDPDDDYSICATSGELPLFGSTCLSNNSVRIMKILPKRLRSLDTFRGFSLMIMILVNYGGKIRGSILLFIYNYLFDKVVVIGFLNILVNFLSNI